MLSLGLDPNLSQLPPEFFHEIGLDSLPDQLRFFCKSGLEASEGEIKVIKFQSAYFEKYGLVGLNILSEMMKLAKAKGFTIILDAKRGDIDRTNQAYADAYLQKNQDFEADFLTVQPYLGLGVSFEPLIKTSIQNHKGIFQMLKTSNIDAEEIQSFQNQNGETLVDFIAQKLEEINQKALQGGYFNPHFGGGYGPVGAVLGATKSDFAKQLRPKMPHTWFLCPGLGKQGGDPGDVEYYLQKDGRGAWFPISSGLTNVSSKEMKQVGSYREAVRKRILDWKQKLNLNKI